MTEPQEDNSLNFLSRCTGIFKVRTSAMFCGTNPAFWTNTGGNALRASENFPESDHGTPLRGRTLTQSAATPGK